MYQTIVNVTQEFPGQPTVEHIHWQSGGSLLPGLEATAMYRREVRAGVLTRTETRVIRAPRED